jgi:hypothetical protein
MVLFPIRFREAFTATILAVDGILADVKRVSQEISILSLQQPGRRD